MPVPRRRPTTRTPTRASTWARIHAVVRRIPRGRVATYGQVAELAGLPGQARLVGYALNGVVEEDRVPWHRVVNASGGISLRAVGGGPGAAQRLRLAREGVHFEADGTVDLARWRWRPKGSAAGRAGPDGVVTGTR